MMKPKFSSWPSNTVPSESMSSSGGRCSKVEEIQRHILDFRKSVQASLLGAKSRLLHSVFDGEAFPREGFSVRDPKTPALPRISRPGVASTSFVLIPSLSLSSPSLEMASSSSPIATTVSPSSIVFDSVSSATFRSSFFLQKEILSYKGFGNGSFRKGCSTSCAPALVIIMAGGLGEEAAVDPQHYGEEAKKN
ncbi:hypothetical protein NE237_024031 [Protea cynaroides]|uniref:Uncharacterized protein n=1 Tax=Protea cynaroides TaxID=273540 RepID=A0A9Q0HHB8_9MAGN|nr:hypothetical protein NE237_024031 [Protea cynaroides]